MENDNLFNQINSLEPYKIEKFFNLEIELPTFLYPIIDNKSIPLDQIINFIERFVLFYLEYGCFALFVDGNYKGVYKHSNDIYKLTSTIYKHCDCLYFLISEQIQTEYKETVIFAGKQSYYINDMKFFDEHSFIVYCSFFEDLSYCENFIFDSGCSINHIMYYDYINLENYKWNNYPYDEYFNEIRDESLRKDFLLDYNEFFLSCEYTSSEISENQNIKRVKIFYKDGFYIYVNGIKVNVKTFLCAYNPKMDEINKNMKKSKSFLTGFLTEKSNIIKRPSMDKKLLGLNLIKQLNINIKSVYGGSKMIITDSDESLIQNYINYKHDKYMVLLLKSPIYLYYETIETEDCSGFFFGLKDDYINDNYLGMDTNSERVKTLKNLTLIILNELNTDILQQVQNDSNLDGYIIKQDDCDTLNIYLKDFEKFLNTSSIDDDHWNSKFLSENNSTNLELLYTYKICHWFVDANFRVCN